MLLAIEQLSGSGETGGEIVSMAVFSVPNMRRASAKELSFSITIAGVVCCGMFVFRETESASFNELSSANDGLALLTS